MKCINIKIYKAESFSVVLGLKHGIRIQTIVGKIKAITDKK